MAKTRFQARTYERPSSITLTSDDDAEIPAIAPVPRKRGRPRKGGPTLRPGIRPPANMNAQVTQEAKRKADKEPTPSLRADKRQKRVTPIPTPAGPASRTRARSRTADPEATSESNAAIDALNAFSKPRDTGMCQRSHIQIPLPTERQFLYEQSRAGDVEDDGMPLRSSPPLWRILLPQPEDDALDNPVEGYNKMGLVSREQSVKSKRLSSPAGIHVRESRQPKNPDIPLPSVENSPEENEQFSVDVIQEVTQEPVGQLGQQGEEQDLEEDQDYEEDPEEDRYYEEDPEEDQHYEEDPEEDQELLAANPESPDLSSDRPTNPESPDFSSDSPQGPDLSTIYEVPDQESQALPVPARVPKTINGLTAKRTRKGSMRIPKVSLLEAASHVSWHPPAAELSGLRQFLGESSPPPPRPPAPLPTTSLASRLSGGRQQPEQTLGSSPPQREPTEDRLFFHDDDLDDFIHTSETEQGREAEPIAESSKPNPRANGPGNHDHDLFSSDPFADFDQPEPGSGNRRTTQNTSAGGSRISGPNDSLMIHAPSTLEWDSTTLLPSHLVNQLHKLMGMTGWTELSKTWSTDLLQPDPFESGATDTPAISVIGRQLFKYLVHLKSKLSKAPPASNLDVQNDWLLLNNDGLCKSTTEINKLVKKICEDRLAVIGDSSRPSSNDLERRKALVRDMVLCVIPMLVHTLWHAFSLGGMERDMDGNLCLAEEGEFTTTTLHFLFRTTGWLLRLDRIVMFEMSHRPYKHYLIDGLSEDNRRAYPEKAKKKRLELGKLLKDWNSELKEAMSELENWGEKERAEKERERVRLARLEREPLVKARKIQAQKEEEEKKRKQYEDFCLSTQRIRSSLEGRFFDQEEGEGGSSVTEGGEEEEEEVVDGEEKLPPYEGGEYELWDNEDSCFLLSDIREIVGKGKRVTKQVYEDLAEALGKPLGEVIYEARKLRLAGRIIARERGVEVEEWAREV